MKTLDLIGYHREDLGKKTAKKLRLEGNVPCVMYGGEKVMHFYVPMILFREVTYTPEVHILKLDIEGEIHECILQDIQFHPVSDIILHADFLELKEDRPVKIEVPVNFTGSAPGLLKGGKLAPKLRKVKVKALPKDLPDVIDVPVGNLDLGKSVKVRDLPETSYEILNNPMVTIATIQIPRSLRSAQRAGEAE